MTLEEIFEEDADAGVPLDFPKLVVDVPEAMLRSTCRELAEGNAPPPA